MGLSEPSEHKVCLKTEKSERCSDRIVLTFACPECVKANGRESLRNVCSHAQQTEQEGVPRKCCLPQFATNFMRLAGLSLQNEGQCRSPQPLGIVKPKVVQLETISGSKLFCTGVPRCSLP